MASAFAARATVLGSAVMLMHMVMAHGRVDSRGEDLLCAKLKTMPLPLCALVKNGTAENVDSFETMSAAWTLVAPDLVYVKTELYHWRIVSCRVCCIASIARDSIMRYQRAVCTTSLKLQAGGTPDSPHLRRGSASSPTLFREWVRPDPPRHSEPAWCVCRIACMLWDPQHANLTRISRGRLHVSGYSFSCASVYVLRGATVPESSSCCRRVQRLRSCRRCRPHPGRRGTVTTSASRCASSCATAQHTIAPHTARCHASATASTL